MKLEPLMTIRAELKSPMNLGVGPYGTRLLIGVTGGRFTGSRLQGTVLPGGGDWLLLDAEGTSRVDVRITLETNDGALIHVQYYGVLEMNEQANKALMQGSETAYGDTYFMTQPRYETGDKRYKWLNRAVAVAEGRLLPNAVEYQVYELTH